MVNSKPVYTVYETCDYDQFSKMDGNRAVLDGRVSKIRKSIEANGYRKNVAIVTDGMAVVDGQGRLEACKCLSLPFYYAYIPGLTLDDCQTLNSTNTNWTTTDFIRSHAEAGDDDYRSLLNLIERFSSKDFPENTVINIATKGGNQKTAIAQKTTKFEDFQFAEYVSDVYSQMSEDIAFVGGSKNHWASALKKCLSLGMDSKRLLANVKKYKADTTKMYPIATDDQGIRAFLNVYNAGLRKGQRFSIQIQ